MDEKEDIYFLVVKSTSCSEGLKLPSAAFSQVQAPAIRKSVSTSEPSQSRDSVLTSSSGAACAGRSRGLGVLGSGTIAGAFASRTSTARAAGSGDGVLGWGLVAGAVESRLLAARALSLLSCEVEMIR